MCKLRILFFMCPVICSALTIYYERRCFHELLSVPLLYHSMGQIIKSVFFVCVCMYVCMYVCKLMYVCICGHDYGRIIQPIFTKLGKNLWGLNRKN